MSQTINLNEAKDFLVELLPKAGEILLKYFGSENLKSHSKGGVDFATEADLATDEFLRSEISKKFPNAKFLTEETAPKDYSPLRSETDLWIIDPLDGTTNFSRGVENFSISVGLVDKGVSKLGVVYFPINKKTYSVSADSDDTYIVRQGFKVSNISDLGKSTAVVEWAYKEDERKRSLNYLSKFASLVRQIKSEGSGVKQLIDLAEGKVDIFLTCGIKPWDLAAASLMVKKAGGKMTKPTGEDADIFESDILVTNGHLHQTIVDLIKS